MSNANAVVPVAVKGAQLMAWFGGTFDPVHHGHLRAAEEAALALATEVRLLPTSTPAHRPQPQASADQRLELLQIALAGQNRLLLDGRELRRAGPSYSVDTLIELRAEFGNGTPLALIVGADAFAGLPDWHRWRELFGLAHLVVLNRPGAAGPEQWSSALQHEVAARWASSADELRLSVAGRVLAIDITPLAISATAIRAQLAAGGSVRWLLPEAVLTRIEAQGLYAGASAGSGQ
ncbi:MAG: nicotinate-nucleotide adenylyltransferase [Lysobacterales bacterium]